MRTTQSSRFGYGAPRRLSGYINLLLYPFYHSPLHLSHFPQILAPNFRSSPFLPRGRPATDALPLSLSFHFHRRPVPSVEPSLEPQVQLSFGESQWLLLVIPSFPSQIFSSALSLSSSLGLNMYLLHCPLTLYVSPSLPVCPELPPFFPLLLAAVALSPQPHSRRWTPVIYSGSSNSSCFAVLSHAVP